MTSQPRTTSSTPVTNVSRPPTALYEVATKEGDSFRAEGDAIEQGDGWFTLWTADSTLALRLPEGDIRYVRAVSPSEPDPVDRQADEQLRQAEIRAALAEHQAEAYQQQIQILAREMLRERGAADDELPTDPLILDRCDDTAGPRDNDGRCAACAGGSAR
ncbi:hypothetical protein ACFWPV_09705 [Streptomyces uncialis]|uniref:hypothetical protein n=1 Tax=Streptomyces uncialis TaxID=1048205 RepID=UPI00364BB047